MTMSGESGAGEVTADAFAHATPRGSQGAPIPSTTRDNQGPNFDEAINAVHGPDDSADKGPGFWSTLGEKVKGVSSGAKNLAGSALGKAESLYEAATKNKVGRFLRSGVESYLNKFNWRDKNKVAWGGGILVGAGGVITVAEFGATLGLSPAIRAITTAATVHLSNFVYKLIHEQGYIRHYALSGMDQANFDKGQQKALRTQILALEKEMVATKLKGQAFTDEYTTRVGELLRQNTPYREVEGENNVIEQDQEWIRKTTEKLVKIGSQYVKVDNAAKSLAAGLAAGACSAALFEVGIRSILKGGIKEGLFSQDTVGSHSEAVTPPSGQDAIPSGGLPTNVQQKIAEISNSQEYKTDIAANVGKYLPVPDQITEKALQAKNLLLASIDTDTLNVGHDAVLHAMEGKGNEIYGAALKEVLASNPNASLDDVVKAAAVKYANYIASIDTQTQLQELAQKAIQNHFESVNKILGEVSQTLNTSPDLYHEVVIQKGDTVGALTNLHWINADAPNMGATIAANYHTLTDMWAQMAASNPDLVPNTPFPVSLSEINFLVLRAQAGDEEAIKKLRLALHWIPAGAKFKVLTQAGIQQVLKKVA